VQLPGGLAVTAAVAVDFDGVIHGYRQGWRDGAIYDEPVPGALDALRTLMADYAVFVHTTRRPEDVAEWLAPLGFDVTVDDRCPACLGTEDLPCSICQGAGLLLFWNERDRLLVTGRKLAAVAYIDDRAIRFESWAQTLSDLDEIGRMAS
jgi:hypothetical protein